MFSSTHRIRAMHTLNMGFAQCLGASTMCCLTILRQAKKMRSQQKSFESKKWNSRGEREKSRAKTALDKYMEWICEHTRILILIVEHVCVCWCTLLGIHGEIASLGISHKTNILYSTHILWMAVSSRKAKTKFFKWMSQLADLFIESGMSVAEWSACRRHIHVWCELGVAIC